MVVDEREVGLLRLRVEVRDDEWSRKFVGREMFSTKLLSGRLADESGSEAESLQL